MYESFSHAKSGVAQGASEAYESSVKAGTATMEKVAGFTDYAAEKARHARSSSFTLS